MPAEKAKAEKTSVLSVIVQHWVPPAITAILGLFAGISVATYNSKLDTNKFFLEKQAKTADNIAIEFSRYVENWTRLVRVRKEFDAKTSEPSEQEKEYFKKVVFERADARDKLFSFLDSAHLYYSDDVSVLVVKFREWDDQQSSLTIDKLPDIKEWRSWQMNILRQLHKENSR